MIASPDPKPSRWLRPAAGIAALITLSAATGWGVASFAGAASGPDTTKVRAALKLRLPNTPIDAITCKGLGGLCEVASKSTLFYVDRAAKYLVIGRVYDMEARQDLTAARLLALNPDLLAAGVLGFGLAGLLTKGGNATFKGGEIITGFIDEGVDPIGEPLQVPTSNPPPLSN